MRYRVEVRNCRKSTGWLESAMPEGLRKSSTRVLPRRATQRYLSELCKNESDVRRLNVWVFIGFTAIGR